MAAIMNHAKDYLIDFAQNKVTDSWLKSLIFETILSNGNINPTVLDRIYNSLINNTTNALPALPGVGNSQSSDLSFTSLKHNSGVSALNNNETIKFCENVTILYGLNGSGKSSYFRILNEIVGGNQKKEILSNIYDSSPSPISVEFKYKIGNNNKEIQWDNTQRALSDFRNTKIFDSSYLNSFLDLHTVDQAIIQPFGLNLFRDVIDKIEEIKRKLRDNITSLQSELPLIDTSKFSEGLKECFHSQKDVTRLKDSVIGMTFSDDDNKNKNSYKKNIEQLNSTNIADHICVMETLKKEYKKFYDKVKKEQESLDKFVTEAGEILQSKQKAIKDAEIAKEKISLLKDIPGSDSSDWKNFIKEGIQYASSAAIKGVCPYCRQRLQNDAEKLIIAYSDFLNDKSQEILKNAEKKVTKFNEELRKIDCSFNFIELFENDLKEKGQNESARDILEKMDAQKQSILLFMEGNDLENQVTNIETKTIFEFLEKRIADIEDEVEKCKQNDADKKIQVGELTKKINLLEERESVVLQKADINRWFSIYDKIQDFEKKYSSIKTNSISSLASIAYNNLVSEKLINNFNEILTSIVGYAKIEVSLKPVSVNKGIAKTQLVLTNGTKVQGILSEGEQKAVGLALFLAEIKTQSSKCPIIFDDPVNSLDHKIAANFAELLLSLDNQIVIFSHNRLFIDAFECSKNNHVCKTMGSACNTNRGKHILIYSVTNEGKNCKGVIQYYKAHNVKAYLDSAKRLLQSRPFENSSAVASDIRHAIECLIDEKILNNITPTKYSNKNSRINWEELKKVGMAETDIDKLNQMHSRLSGSDMHNGTEASENPIEKEEFESFVQELERMIQ